MANLQITSAMAGSAPQSLTGVGVDPMVYFDWNVKTLFPTAVAGDYIYTPYFDLNAVAPKCNRVLGMRRSDIASAASTSLHMSSDGTTTYTMPMFNGGAGGGTATSSANTTELALHGLPGLRYVRMRVLLDAAMSTFTEYRLCLSLMRY